MQGIIDGRLFACVQCDIEVPEHLRDCFSNFPPVFKNTVVSRDDIGNLMKQCAEKEKITKIQFPVLLPRLWNY